MSVIKMLRKLSDSEKAKTGILIGLGLMSVLPCVWLGISKPESLFDLHYIRGHGHTAVPHYLDYGPDYTIFWCQAAICEINVPMVIIKLQPLREFIEAYPDARASLSQWISTVEQAD